MKSPPGRRSALWAVWPPAVPKVSPRQLAAHWVTVADQAPPAAAVGLPLWPTYRTPPWEQPACPARPWAGDSFRQRPPLGCTGLPSACGGSAPPGCWPVPPASDTSLPTVAPRHKVVRWHLQPVTAPAQTTGGPGWPLKKNFNKSCDTATLITGWLCCFGFLDLLLFAVNVVNLSEAILT